MVYSLLIKFITESALNVVNKILFEGDNKK